MMDEDDWIAVFELGYKAALQYAQDEGWAHYPDSLEQSVLAGNAALIALKKLASDA